MSVEKSEGKFWIQCDLCGRQGEKKPAFRDALWAARHEVFKEIQTGGGFDHHCPDCNGHTARKAENETMILLNGL